MSEALWKDVVETQNDLLLAQGKLINQLLTERNEAIRNLKTATVQWEQWRADGSAYESEELQDLKQKLYYAECALAMNAETARQLNEGLNKLKQQLIAVQLEPVV